jgi:hypothetical protein
MHRTLEFSHKGIQAHLQAVRLMWLPRVKMGILIVEKLVIHCLSAPTIFNWLLEFFAVCPALIMNRN